MSSKAQKCLCRKIFLRVGGNTFYKNVNVREPMGGSDGVWHDRARPEGFYGDGKRVFCCIDASDSPSTDDLPPCVSVQREMHSACFQGPSHPPRSCPHRERSRPSTKGSLLFFPVSSRTSFCGFLTPLGRLNHKTGYKKKLKVV